MKVSSNQLKFYTGCFVIFPTCTNFLSWKLKVFISIYIFKLLKHIMKRKKILVHLATVEHKKIVQADFPKLKDLFIWWTYEHIRINVNKKCSKPNLQPHTDKRFISWATKSPGDTLTIWMQSIKKTIN